MVSLWLGFENTMKRKICIVTGSRAEYGLLKPLMEEIRGDDALSLQVIVTGMHLSPEFGLTYKEIENDKFKINERIEILLSSDSPVGISKTMGLAMGGFAEAYGRLSPDIVVVLGDRFEIFSAIAAALVCRLPTAHIHGGELTEGAIDDAFRHSITKMSCLHFTALEEYRKRVIQLGESPDRVFNVGALGLDNIKRVKLLSGTALEKKFALKFDRRNLLITFHPVTVEKNLSEEQFKNLLGVLDELKNTALIFTKANADMDGRIINKMIDRYVSDNSRKAVAFTSMGQQGYLSAMGCVDAVVGNSSSGIIEAPSFRIGTINIGDRQKGRVRAKSVIDCRPARKSIRNAISKLYSAEFQEKLKGVVNPYGNADAAKKIRTILRDYQINNILKKSFFDINFNAQSQVRSNA